MVTASARGRWPPQAAGETRLLFNTIHIGVGMAVQEHEKDTVLLVDASRLGPPGIFVSLDYKLDYKDDCARFIEELKLRLRPLTTE
jgi:hypothetical protein